jgi:hypothetical protein
MAIRIRQTPFTRSGDNPGPYPMHPDDVLAQLIVIAMAGSTELPGTLGDDPDPVDSEYTIVSYDPGPQDTTTPEGRVRQRLKDLIDGGEDIKIFGVGADFVWSDGSTISDSAGGAIGSWIFYDTKNCDGDGRWVRGTDGEEVCVSSAGILYHELGHVFLDHGLGSIDDEEREAVEFENDLRTAEGRVPRDPNNWHESECDCPDDDCCIVASVSTGSPFSAEVHALRRFRERTLRRTAFGMYFFEVMHREYYSFSVGVSRILATSETARGLVAEVLVRPLVRALELGQEYVRSPDNATRLGELVVTERDTLPPPLTWETALRLLDIMAGGSAELPAADGSLGAVFQILRDKLPECPHVRWAIVDVLRIYAAARTAAACGADTASIGERLRQDLDGWVASIPLEYLRDHMTESDWARDLPQLAATFFTSEPARRQFRQRLGPALQGYIQ